MQNKFISHNGSYHFYQAHYDPLLFMMLCNVEHDVNTMTRTITALHQPLLCRDLMCSMLIRVKNYKHLSGEFVGQGLQDTEYNYLVINLPDDSNLPSHLLDNLHIINEIETKLGLPLSSVSYISRWSLGNTGEKSSVSNGGYLVEFPKQWTESTVDYSLFTGLLRYCFLNQPDVPFTLVNFVRTLPTGGFIPKGPMAEEDDEYHDDDVDSLDFEVDYDIYGSARILESYLNHWVELHKDGKVSLIGFDLSDESKWQCRPGYLNPQYNIKVNRRDYITPIDASQFGIQTLIGLVYAQMDHDYDVSYLVFHQDLVRNFRGLYRDDQKDKSKQV